MRLDDHPLWEPLRQYLYRQHYARSGPVGPLYRIEMKEPTTRSFRSALLDMVIHCATCERAIHPVRARRSMRPPFGVLYIALTCEQRGRIECSRNPRAAAEIARILAVMSGHPTARQVGLFD